MDVDDRVTKGGAAIALGAYLTVLWAHAILPDTASFALALASMAVVVATGLLIVAGRSGDPRHVRLPIEERARAANPVSFRDSVTTRMPPVDNLVGRLRVIEAELHALEDQRVSEHPLSASMPLPLRPGFGR